MGQLALLEEPGLQRTSVISPPFLDKAPVVPYLPLGPASLLLLFVHLGSLTSHFPRMDQRMISAQMLGQT